MKTTACILALCLAACGGTFTLTPTGTITYTTPKLLTPEVTK